MNNKDTVEGNKLIAEFMGWICKERKSYNDGRLVLYTDKDKIFKYGGISYLLNKNPWDAPLKYNESYDWLMPVVDKIESLTVRPKDVFDDKVKVKLLGDHVEIFCYSTFRGKAVYWKNYLAIDNNTYKHANQKPSRIEAVYEAIIEFIEWYNKNK